jgi:hypothetical protein
MAPGTRPLVIQPQSLPSPCLLASHRTVCAGLRAAAAETGPGAVSRGRAWRTPAPVASLLRGETQPKGRGPRLPPQTRCSWRMRWMRVGLRAPHRPCDLPTGRPAVERGRGSRHSTAFPHVGADVCHRGHVEQRHGLAYRCLEACKHRGSGTQRDVKQCGSRRVGIRLQLARTQNAFLQAQPTCSNAGRRAQRRQAAFCFVPSTPHAQLRSAALPPWRCICVHAMTCHAMLCRAPQ